MMSSRGGKLKEEREGGRKGGRAIDSGSRGAQPLYLQGHTPTKLDKMAKSKKRQFYTFRVLDGIFSLII